MADRKGFWGRVTDARRERSWLELVAVLFFWSGLLAFQAFEVFTGRTDRVTSIISVFLLPLGVLQTGSAMVRKARKGR
ncbi:hypothetical protein ACGF12_38065 [Kitasatospora sp. NPDC048296]|uniref:hypothetical protein n=1 Tax=Kitasatospora sp. NPDC048296 TaxID=3364048 RepID=UPI0037183276